jgi:hypothetical protein
MVIPSIWGLSHAWPEAVVGQRRGPIAKEPADVARRLVASLLASFVNVVRWAATEPSPTSTEDGRIVVWDARARRAQPQ